MFNCSIKAFSIATKRSTLIALTLCSSMTAAHAQALPIAPARWVYSATPATVPTGQASFSGWPTIVVPAMPGVKRVVDCVSITYGGISAGNNRYRIVQLEDGAAGATPLMRWSINPVTITDRDIHICGLGVVGTAGNALTLRVFNPLQSTYHPSEWVTLNLVGYDAQ
jgi:hypothetical protein